MKRSLKNILIVFLFFIFACATAGQKYIQINYTGSIDSTASGTVGLSPVTDNRNQPVQGRIGYRILLDNSQETFLVQGMDLGKALTRAAQAYLEKKGFHTVQTEPWELTPEGVSTMGPDFYRLVTGTVNRFECLARKKGGHTTMVLDIEMIFYAGNPQTEVLKTIPVKFSLEKTVFTFTPRKLESFVNESLAEIFEKGLVL